MSYVNDRNRELVQAKYIDSIIVNLDFMQVREMLREYLNGEKTYYTNEELEDEIKARGLWWDTYETTRGMEVLL
jgi:hypothetical protein